MTERDYLLALHRIPEIGPITLRELHDYFGGYEKIWWAPARELRGLLRQNQVKPFFQVRDSLDVGSLSASLDRAGIDTLTVLDESYPPLLREIHAPPSVLYLKGSLPKKPLVAIVGTRRATAEGVEMTRRIASDLTKAGVAIVSGLAYGIDIAAHRAVLREGGETVAVLASLVGEVSPTAHRGDAEEIGKRGALVSEYAPGVQPQPGLFIARNRIIAGLAAATIVIEAPERSGALITAGHALSENRDVLAVPGSILSANSAGAHALIRQGATLIRSAEDVLEVLGLPGLPLSTLVPPASETEAQIIKALEGPTHFDTIAVRTELPAARLGGLLTEMELHGSIRHLGANIYSK